MSVWSDTGGLNILQEVVLSLLVYLLSVWFRFYFHPLCAHYAEYRAVITESGIKRPQLRNVKLTSASLTLSLLTFHVCFVLYTEKGSGMQMFCSLSFYYYVQNSNSRSWLFFCITYIATLMLYIFNCILKTSIGQLIFIIHLTTALFLPKLFFKNWSVMLKIV